MLLSVETTAEIAEPTRFSDYQIKILEGTYDAIARLGAQQLSLRGIARELGVSPSLLTYHFGTHENLVIETMRWVLEGSIQSVRRRLAEARDPGGALTALLDQIFASPRGTRDRELVYIDLIQYAVRHQAFSGLSRMLRTRMNDSCAEVIRAGVQAGDFQVDDIGLAVRHTRAVLEGSILQWLQEEDWEQTHAALRADCERALLVLLRHSGESER
jgi:AcrR family transcriptional regulator